MRSPLVAVTLIYIGGIVTGDLLPLPPRPFLYGLLGFSLLALLLSTLRPAVIWPLVFVTGATNLNLHTSILTLSDLRLLARVPEEVTLRGRLTATPEIRSQLHDDRLSFRTLASLAVTGLRRPGEDWRAANGRVVVTTPTLLPQEIHGGQWVAIEGVLAAPPRAIASGLFDYGAYLRRQEIYYELKTTSSNSWSGWTQQQVAEPWSDRFLHWAKPCLARGFPGDDPAIQLVWAMVLGWKTPLNGEVSEPFMRSGTMHVFAVSGLHISLISLVLVALLRTGALPRSWCGLVVIPVIWFYTAAIGWQASAVRSTVMMTIIIAGWSLRRPPDLLNSLAAAAMVVLLADPQQLFQAGFQLSFLVVLSLALFAPVLQKLGEPLWEHDPLLPALAMPWWKRTMLAAGRQLGTSLATSLAAWLGSIPLVAHYFHYLTPVSLLANLIIVPLSGLSLMSAMGSLMVAPLAPWLSILFNHGAWFWMKLMIWSSAWTADLPGAWFNVSGPSLLTVLVYYLLLVLIMTGWIFQRRFRLRAGAGAAVVSVVWVMHFQHERSITELSVLPLNGGEAFFLRGGPAGGEHLVDCGGERPTAAVTAPYLRVQGVNHLDTFTLTHGEARNVAGAQIIFDQFKPLSICASPVNFRSPVYRELSERMRATARWQTVERGNFLGPWRVLHPAGGDKFASADDAALVLAGEFCGTKVLLLSDLGRRGQEAAFSGRTNQQVDILVSGLPTGSEPLMNSLLQILQPRVIIVTDDEFPSSARASRALHRRLEGIPALVLWTRESGALKIRFTTRGWTICTAAGKEYTSQSVAREAIR